MKENAEHSTPYRGENGSRSFPPHFFLPMLVDLWLSVVLFYFGVIYTFGSFHIPTHPQLHGLHITLITSLSCVNTVKWPVWTPGVHPKSFKRKRTVTPIYSLSKKLTTGCYDTSVRWQEDLLLLHDVRTCGVCLMIPEFKGRRNFLFFRLFQPGPGF